MARAGFDDTDTGSIHRAVMTGAPTSDIAGDQVLTRDAKVSDWQRANGDVAKAARPGGFDRWLRGIVTGKWDGAEESARSRSEHPLRERIWYRRRCPGT